MDHVARRAPLLVDLPPSRYRLSSISSLPPRAGDIVALDQGFTAQDGSAMVLVYFPDAGNDFGYEAEVYESELGPNVSGLGDS